MGYPRATATTQSLPENLPYVYLHVHVYLHAMRIIDCVRTCLSAIAKGSVRRPCSPPSSVVLCGAGTEERMTPACKSDDRDGAAERLFARVQGSLCHGSFAPAWKKSTDIPPTILYYYHCGRAGVGSENFLCLARAPRRGRPLCIRLYAIYDAAGVIIAWDGRLC